MVFQSGHDFLGDLEDFGFPTGQEANRTILAAAEGAWERLGARWLRDFKDHPLTPWALEEFGPQPGGDHAG
jgi:hypothetical protein